MIVFDLECQAGGHRFEGWFASSEDFAGQCQRGLVECPACGSAEVIKAPMAPRLGRKGNQVAPAPKPVAGGAIPPQVRQALTELAQAQAAALKDSRWVGSAFAEESRAIHYGKREAEVIHGQATAEEARSLVEEGVAIVPLPFPVAPPEELN